MSKRQPTYFPQSSFNEKEKHEATEQTLQKLAREGLIVDTGRRRWSIPGIHMPCIFEASTVMVANQVLTISFA